MLSLWGIGVRPEDGLIYLFSTDMRSRAARLRRRNVTVGVSLRDNLDRATPSASWSDSAARSVIDATRFRSRCFPSRDLKDAALVHFLVRDILLRDPWHYQRTLDLAVFAQLRKYATIAGKVKFSFLNNPDRTTLDFPTPRTLRYPEALPRE